MATVYKALTLPTLLQGVPIAPFIISVFCLIILGLIITKWMWLLIWVLYFLLRNMTARDEHVFTLIWVGWKALGKKSKLISRHVANRFFAQGQSVIPIMITLICGSF